MEKKRDLGEVKYKVAESVTVSDLSTCHDFPVGDHAAVVATDGASPHQDGRRIPSEGA